MSATPESRGWFDKSIPLWGIVLLFLGFGGWCFSEYQNSRDTQIMVKSHAAQIKDMQDSLALVKQQSFIMTENLKVLQKVEKALETIQDLQRYQAVTDFRLGNLECKNGMQCGGGAKR